MSDINLDHQSKACINLWAAVFVDGIRSAAKEYFGKKGGTDLRWFLSEEKHVGSFVWLCDLFEISPGRARSEARMKFRKFARQQKNLEVEV